MVVQARGGVDEHHRRGSGPPVRVGASIGDIVAGMFLAQGVLAALYDRERTGRGAKVDIAMLDAHLAIQEHAIAIASATGTPPGRTGGAASDDHPLFHLRASDGFFVIAAGNDAMFRRLCEALPLPLAGDPRFATNAARCENNALLKRLIEAVTLGGTVAQWTAVLEGAGLPTARVQDMGEVQRAPSFWRGPWCCRGCARGGARLRGPGQPDQDDQPARIAGRPPAPRLDGDRAAILEWLEGGEAPLSPPLPDPLIRTPVRFLPVNPPCARAGKGRLTSPAPLRGRKGRKRPAGRRFRTCDRALSA